MLLKFRLRNFRSAKDELVLDLEASSDKELKEVVRKTTGLAAKSHGVLPVATIFGANASGKTTLIKAAKAMRERTFIERFSTGEFTLVSGANRAALTPFRFEQASQSAPVLLEAEFLLNGVRHLYGFESVTSDLTGRAKIISEWLYSWPKKQRVEVFLRGNAAQKEGKPEGILVSEEYFDGGMKRARELIANTREDTLFVVAASDLNQAQAMAVSDWFRTRFMVMEVSEQPFFGETVEVMRKHPEAVEFVHHLLGSTGTGVSKLKVAAAKQDAYEYRPDEPDPNLERILTLHRDAAGIEHWLSLADESLGTQRLISLAGHIYLALKEGRCLWVDELNHSLHHWLLRALVSLFQNPEANPNGAQLIFTSHDPALMDPTLLRRDQIWITEKDSARSTTLYSLSDIEDKPRKSQPLYKSFLSGRFGGVPMQLDTEKLLHWNRPEGV